MVRELITESELKEFDDAIAKKAAELRTLAEADPKGFRKRIDLAVAQGNIKHPEWAEGGVPLTREGILASYNLEDLRNLWK